MNLEGAIDRFRTVNAMVPAFVCAALALATPAWGSTVTTVLLEDFESYEPGRLEEGGTGEIDRTWFLFTGPGKKVSHHPEAAVLAGSGAGGSKALRLSAGIRPETGPFFYVGIRRMFSADLSGVDLDRLRLTAQVRIVVRDGGSASKRKRREIPPPEFAYAFRLESIRKHRLRGLRQFTSTGSRDFTPVGGLLSEAISGRELRYRELRLSEGPALYQLVLVISSRYLDGRHARGNHDLELYVDDILLEVVERESPAPPTGGEMVRFSPDRCRSARCR